MAILNLTAAYSAVVPVQVEIPDNITIDDIKDVSMSGDTVWVTLNDGTELTIEDTETGSVNDYVDYKYPDEVCVIDIFTDGDEL